jgi:hypothetical protein
MAAGSGLNVGRGMGGTSQFSAFSRSLAIFVEAVNAASTDGPR